MSRVRVGAFWGVRAPRQYRGSTRERRRLKEKARKELAPELLELLDRLDPRKLAEREKT